MEPLLTYLDIDLFVYGLTEEEANKKLVEIYEAITDALPVKAICFRSKHAVTIVSQFPYRHIQIILRLYPHQEIKAKINGNISCVCSRTDTRNVTIDFDLVFPTYSVHI